jgi:hypothetical protein
MPRWFVDLRIRVSDFVPVHSIAWGMLHFLPFCAKRPIAVLHPLQMAFSAHE